MDVLEAIRTRRTARMPFDDTAVPEPDLRALEGLAQLAPDGGAPAWRLVRIEDRAVKARLAGIVRAEFGTTIQRDRRQFRRVFAQYPRWLRFSPAHDGIRLMGMPSFMRAPPSERAPSWACPLAGSAGTRLA